MPRIVGVDIPKNKTVEIALTAIFGLGRKLARDVADKAGVSPTIRAKDLKEDEVAKLAIVIQKDYMVEGDLRRDRAQNIKRLMNIGSYRGLRHRRGLPVRGQRTHTNARTRKGPGQAVGAKRKKKQ
ncbi:MAG: 30S ribosomal protein S13 [Candidatus Auribacterota bacterium]|nr:30S ribosomal protein S13 [Candidatus Auribacterota bacterium]